MSERILRVGVIGAGWIAGEHCESLGHVRGAQVVAVADLDLDRAQRLAAQHGARAYGDAEALLTDEELGAVIVATPPGAHRGPAVAALEQGVAVYIEKPIARTLADAMSILAAIDRTGGIAAVGYQWRAVEALDLLQAELADQEVGLLVSRGVGITQAREWFHDPVQSGRLISERGSHHIDLQRAVAGDVVSVQAARGRVRFSGQVDGSSDEVEDIVSMTLQFAGGALGTINVVWAREGFPSTQDLAVVATNGAFHLALDPDFVLRGMSRGRELESTGREHPFTRGLATFVEAVRNRTPADVRCTVADAVGTLAVSLACEQALSTGETVLVDSPLTIAPTQQTGG